MAAHHRLQKLLRQHGRLNTRTFASLTSTPDVEYDYIVVGAGTAGCLLGNRLSKDPSLKVLVIEAGPNDSFPLIHVPLGYLYTMTHPLTSWGYSTTIQPGLNGKALRYPRGRVLGGCSSINGMIYQRGQKNDYDHWCQSIQNVGTTLDNDGNDISGEWSFNDMEQYFDQHLDYADELAFPKPASPSQTGNSATASCNDGDDAGFFDSSKWGKLKGGEWHVEKQRLSWNILEDFKATAIKAGFPELKHFNNSNTKGCGYFQVNQNSGIRLSAYRAFLRPVMDRTNLHVCKDVHVQKLHISNTREEEERKEEIGDDGGKRPARRDIENWPRDVQGNKSTCLGVYIKDAKSPGGSRLVKVRREVLLTAGAIGSPHILQCSGVGNGHELADKGVELKVNLPGVGENLQDHLQIRSVYKLKEGTVTVNHWSKAGTWAGKIMLGAEYMLNQSGPLSMAPSQFGIFAHSGVKNYHGMNHHHNNNNSSESPIEGPHDGKHTAETVMSANGESRTPDTPDLQFHVQPLSLDDLSVPDSLHKFPGFTTSVCNLRPTSRGTVKLSSPSTLDPPQIDPQYLSTERDCLVAANALRLARKLVLEASPEFIKKYEPEEYKPGLHISTDKELAAAAGDISSSIFHPIGTCRMSKPTLSNGGDNGRTVNRKSNGHYEDIDPLGVVNHQLKVKGLQNVRVCDASVMPTITSGNTNSPILAIAEKAAKMILLEK